MDQLARLEMTLDQTTAMLRALYVYEELHSVSFSSDEDGETSSQEMAADPEQLEHVDADGDANTF